MKKFRDAVQSGDVSISAELTLTSESTADDVRRQAVGLRGLVDGVQVTDNPWSWAQMSAVAAAALLLQNRIDPIPRLTCRDRNRIALQGDLLGLRALGVTSLMLTRGHRIPSNHQLKATAVFDTTGRELIGLANDMNEDSSITPGEQFFIGTGARAFRPGKKWRAESLTARATAGARFLQTQLCFNPGLVRAYVEALVRTRLTWKYSVLISLAVLPNAETASWLKKNLPDSRIPAKLMERIENAADTRSEGIRICAELMREIADIPGVSGINLITMGDADAIPEAIRESGLRA